ncbi:hypothetical protein [Streptomyces sp. AC558_RSS880]|uniref:hypothetical protein n=1 Tax=Streptomyces sp. AC558_RSS880 TaxID=2823687 RepID=UPI001C227F5D|nr:hypothetical protein [Streptomyces sp. AC558_RSS880]
MSENSTAATDLTSQYSAQVAGDLERNVKEQERVTAEIAALQEQLTVLQHDHTLLVNMRQALGLASAPAEAVGTPEPAVAPEAVGTSQPVGTPEAVEAPEADTAPGGATVPAPRKRGGARPAATSGEEKPKRARKTAARTASGKSTPSGKGKSISSGKSAPSGKSTRKPPAAKAEKPKADGPKLVELVRRHLEEQNEPRSAAEVAGALGQAHPERAIKTTVVRSTLEGLVARNQAQRTKQGSSVFYTTPDSTEQAPKAEDAARS